MSIRSWKSVFTYCNLHCRVKLNRYLCTSTELYSKKHYRMNNKFTFHEDLKNVDSEHSANKNSSLSSESDEYDQRSNKNSKFTHGFISADLLSQSKSHSPQKTAYSEKTNSKRPSLAYQGEILFGVHPVHLALLQKKRTFYHLYIRKDIDSSAEDNRQKEEILKLARILNIPISFIDSKSLRILAPGAVHQGICLDAGFLPLEEWNEDQYNLETSENKSLWLVLDEILDPMNVGAIMRSAYYFGVDRLFTVRGNSCKLSPTVSKASSGVLEVLDIYQIGNLEEFIMKRKESGWSVISTLAYSNESDMTKPVSADQFSLSRSTVLILGNEGKGIPGNILSLCDTLISIKPGHVLPKGIDSLNVSVAAGIILYALSNSKSR